MKRVFISFRAEDRQQVNGLRLLAANPKFDIEFYDESVQTPYDSANPEYIKQQIREKINRTSVTLCLLSPLTYTSSWVNWELEVSIAKSNTIILMGFPNGPQNLNLPPAVTGRTWFFWDLNFLQRQIDGAQ